MVDNTTPNYTHFNRSPGNALCVTLCHGAGRLGKADAVGDDDHDQRLGLQQPADGASLVRRPIEYAASEARSEQLAADRRVIVHANRGRDKATTVVGQIVAGGGNVEAVVFDVTESEPTATELADILAAAPIQILINNAGIHADAVFPGMSGEQWAASSTAP